METNGIGVLLLESFLDGRAAAAIVLIDEISRSSGTNCDRPYGSRDAQAKSVSLRHSGRTPLLSLIWNNPSVLLAAVPPTSSWFLLACAAGAVLLLLVLIARVRLHPAIALVIGAMALGVAAGMPLKQIPVSFSLGVGNLMGHIAIVLGLGAILGNLLARSGGAGALGAALW